MVFPECYPGVSRVDLARSFNRNIGRHLAFFALDETFRTTLYLKHLSKKKLNKKFKKKNKKIEKIQESSTDMTLPICWRGSIDPDRISLKKEGGLKIAR